MDPNWFYCRVNECPVCHVHVASQLSLKEDPQYDAIVSAIAPQVMKYKKKVIRWKRCIGMKNVFM